MANLYTSHTAGKHIRHFAHAQLSIKVVILIRRMMLSVNSMQHSENDQLQSPRKFG